MKKNIDYYNNNALSFYNRTIAVDLSANYNKFMEQLPMNAHILDAGCGVGRDAKYFQSQGYKVIAFDASQEMVTLATKETALDILNLKFQDINFTNKFDGVWASASLLHIPYNETRLVYQKIHQALKNDGIFYASYKYGQDYMPTEERDFWNMDEPTLLPYLKGLFKVIDLWAEKDSRSKVSPSPEQMWLNFLVRKI
jgi:SAM-dependent methyltransferase